MANISQAMTATQSVSSPGLASLASSATAGWCSAAIDTTAQGPLLDMLFEITLDPANTAPANSKAFFVYFYGGDTTTYETTGAASGGTPGSEGGLTFPDVSANPNNLHYAGQIAYVVADVLQVKMFSAAQVFGGSLPNKIGIAIVNFSGAALAASNNLVTWRGIYATVA